ncbi:MAG: protease SohB [Gammaproteobacteria bacterium]|nr:protease SohB [Gammaproteobacteria bacterium]
MEFLFDYLGFLARTATIVVAIVIVITAIAGLSRRQQRVQDGYIEITRINDRLRDMRRTIRHATLSPKQFKNQIKQEDKTLKKQQKEPSKGSSVFVLDFEGDIQASKVGRLRNEITAVLTGATHDDEIVVRLESAGGMVHAYGLAASQLARVKSKGIKLTAAVDKVAASGGYLMAAVADSILAAPFALVGSIGVIAQIPNVHRLLKKHDIDVEVLTAGEYKRTLTVLGENTEQGKAKFMEELEDTHALFQEFVSANRPQLEMAEVATGESWYGQRAIDRKLVDRLCTSDEYLMDACDERDVFEVRWVEHKKPIERILDRFSQVASNTADKLLGRFV